MLNQTIICQSRSYKNCLLKNLDAVPAAQSYLNTYNSNYKKPMIKINYNRNNPLVHRFISHIDQSEANLLYNRVNSLKQSKKDNQKQNYRNQSKRKSDFSEPAFATQQTKIITEFSAIKENRQSQPKTESYQETRFGDFFAGNNKRIKINEGPKMIRNNSQDQSDPYLNEFTSDESINFSLLREGYLRICYEKMALENSFNHLVSQNMKKDQTINQMRQQLQQKNGFQTPSSIFYNPQTPLHNQGQNKTINSQQNPNHSIHSNSMNQIQNQNQGNMNQWGSIYPNRNFNPVAARNF